RYNFCTSISLTSAPLFIPSFSASSESSSSTRQKNLRFLPTFAQGSGVAGDFARNDRKHYGNRRAPPENGLGGGGAAGDLAANSAVITRLPSFNPSITSVTSPSLYPVSICTGCGRTLDKT